MATPTSLPATFVAGNVLTAAQMNDLRGAFRVLQVVSTTKTDTFVASSLAQAAASDITGMTVAITPSSTSSKILVIADTQGAANVGGGNRGAFAINLYRDSTLISVGDVASNRNTVSRFSGTDAGGVGMSKVTAIALDSPNTTSAITYKVAVVNALNFTGTATIYVNRTQSDTDANYFARAASTITVMEVSA